MRSERKETKSLDEFVRTGMEKMFNRLDNGDKERVMHLINHLVIGIGKYPW